MSKHSEFWYCNACGAQNHREDSECQFCECGGPDCKRDNCSGPCCDTRKWEMAGRRENDVASGV